MSIIHLCYKRKKPPCNKVACIGDPSSTTLRHKWLELQLRSFAINYSPAHPRVPLACCQTRPPRVQVL